MTNIPLIICGAFYALLCVFSIVTGVLYASGKRKLNPVELSQEFVDKMKDPEEQAAFARKMGRATIFVGILQGVSAAAFFLRHSPVLYWIALGFTVFSLGSVAVKLRGKVGVFQVSKCVSYLAVLVVLLLASSRVEFFG